MEPKHDSNDTSVAVRPPRDADVAFAVMRALPAIGAAGFTGAPARQSRDRLERKDLLVLREPPERTGAQGPTGPVNVHYTQHLPSNTLPPSPTPATLAQMTLPPAVTRSWQRSKYKFRPAPAIEARVALSAVLVSHRGDGRRSQGRLDPEREPKSCGPVARRELQTASHPALRYPRNHHLWGCERLPSAAAHRPRKGASLNRIVGFGLVFLPVLACPLLATFPNCIQRYITY
jgi:hypothetical protein